MTSYTMVLSESLLKQYFEFQININMFNLLFLQDLGCVLFWLWPISRTFVVLVEAQNREHFLNTLKKYLEILCMKRCD